MAIEFNPLCPNDAPKQEDEYHNHLHAWMRLQEDTSREVAKEISYLRAEIQKLKQTKTRPRLIGPF
jgi:hypothetical protein